MTAVATLSLFRYRRWVDRHWALWQMLLARRPLNRLPGVRFMKMVGTGSREGFYLAPNTQVWGLLAVWDDMAAAQAQTRASAVYRRYLRRANESTTLYLEAIRAKGEWSGGQPFELAGDRAPGGLTVALTRATVKPRHALSFWARTPEIRAEVPAQPHLLFKVGMAEVPGLQQITFSIWDDFDAMRAFAYRKGGPHAQAIEAVRRDGWFNEELYARFRLLAVDGDWSLAPDFASVKASVPGAMKSAA
ncbi:MAG: spheroidene monooxygenase [Rubrimonas sp.]|uniref:spheroidene monooxygenase n=1 Tax=Rubrimonas sp. TaxID=2036015 RepID=UPI002FDD2E9B